MSTFNGEKYIREQIESVLAQKNCDISLIIRDDGSTDNTVKIIKQMQRDNNNIILYAEENIGAKKSFYRLIDIAVVDGACYTAFCDQDDFWISNKGISAIEKMKTYDDIPCMYYSNLRVVDESLHGNTNMFSKVYATSLGESIIYNFVVGCTLIINQKLLSLIKLYRDRDCICYHDQWISIICSCFDGKKIADNSSHILYRQHGNNVIGAKRTLFKRIKSSLFFEGKGKRSLLARNILKLMEKDINTVRRDELILLGYYRSIKMGAIKLIFKRYFSQKRNIMIRTTLAIIFRKF